MITSLDPSLQNVEKNAKHALKILRCLQLEIFKVRLTIFQHYVLLG